MAPLSVVLALILSAVSVRGVVVDNVTHAEFSGVIAYFPVDRKIIQEKLEEFHSSRFPGDDTKRLSLPDSRPLSDIPLDGQHPVFIGVGHVNDLDFVGDPNLITEWTQFAITIPFLTNGSSPIPDHALVIANFYQRNGDLQVFDPDFAFPLTPIDEVSLDDGTFIARDGDELIELSFQFHTDPCDVVSPHTRHEFEDYFLKVKQMGAETPHFEACESHVSSTRFCSIVREVGDAVMAEAPNFCQTSWMSEHIQNCNASVDVVRISPGFRRLMLLGSGEDPDFFAEETVHGIFKIGLKYPCL